METNEARVQLDERCLHGVCLGGRILAVVQTIIGVGRSIPLELLEERDQAQSLRLEEGGTEGSPCEGFLGGLIERHWYGNVNKSGANCNKREVGAASLLQPRIGRVSKGKRKKERKEGRRGLEVSRGA